jgi:hypothetical protein
MEGGSRAEGGCIHTFRRTGWIHVNEQVTRRKIRVVNSEFYHSYFCEHCFQRKTAKRSSFHKNDKDTWFFLKEVLLADTLSPGIYIHSGAEGG